MGNDLIEYLFAFLLIFAITIGAVLLKILFGGTINEWLTSLTLGILCLHVVRSWRLEP